MAKSSKRILVITPWETFWSLPNEAGVSDEQHFSRGLRRAGFDIHFLLPESDENVEAPAEGVHLHTYPNFFARTARYPTLFKRVSWPRRFDAVVMHRAIELARSIEPDVVLGHSHYTARTTRACADALSIPSVVKLFGVADLVHTEWPRLKYKWKNFEQLAALQFQQDAWIVLNDGTRGADILREQGIPPDKIHFIPNGINMEWLDMEFDRNRIRGQLGFPREAIVALYLSRLVPFKRPRDVIRAIPPALANTSRHLLFVFAGDGPERGPCERLAEQLGVSQHTLFIGSVPHARVPEVMTASDIFVSTNSQSNMALPSCEAFVCGLPVVGYDVGDTAQTIVHGQSGRLVALGDVTTLGKSIAGLANDEVKRTQMGETAKQFARTHFTGWDARVDMEIEILNKLIEARAVAR